MDHSHVTRKTIVLILAAVVLIPLLALTGWYGWRVWTELGSKPWRNPNTILAHDGTTIAEFYADDWRPAEPVLLEELPEQIPLVFLAAEDVRFRRHLGVDPWGVARAAVANVRVGGVAQGGSTITQQLAKTKYFSADRTFRRKAGEALVAVLIELRLSKNDILEAYLNDVYLGHHEGNPVLGIDEGARLYFDRAPADLTLAEAAVLAGMIRAPNRDTVEKNREVITRRRDAILEVMHEQGWITEEELNEARSAAVKLRSGKLSSLPHRYPLSAVRSELIDRIGQRRLRSGGLAIQTTLDLEMQKAAERSVRQGVERLRSSRSWLRRGDDPLQAALLSVDPATGGIRALVGGTDWSRSQFDRSRSMRRQAGSSVKPFIYAAAIDRKIITPATIVSDEPVQITLARNDVWSPRNYDERFRGDVTVREAFEKSLNIPAVRVAENVGVRRVKSLMSSAELGANFSDTSAIALGVDEVSMIALVGAYTAFPNLGRAARPHLVSRVDTSRRRTLFAVRPRLRKVFTPEVAYIIHSMMQGVVERGTASALRRQGLGHVAGKTGTTNNYRDAWFIGYSPDLVTGVWVGFDQGRALRISSAEAALPIWSSYMSAVPHSRDTLAPPPAVDQVRIDRASGGVWRDGCAAAINEFFLRGTAPSEPCRPVPRQQPILVDFEEPPMITSDQLREWLADAPGVAGELDFDIELERAEEGPPGTRPGDIIIQLPEVEAPEPAEPPADPNPPLPPPAPVPPPADVPRVLPPGQDPARNVPTAEPPGRPERRPPEERRDPAPE
jgi:penicillin-binding protein 1B